MINSQLLLTLIVSLCFVAICDTTLNKLYRDSLNKGVPQHCQNFYMDSDAHLINSHFDYTNAQIASFIANEESKLNPDNKFLRQYRDILVYRDCEDWKKILDYPSYIYVAPSIYPQDLVSHANNSVCLLKDEPLRDQSYIYTTNFTLTTIVVVLVLFIVFNLYILFAVVCCALVEFYGSEIEFWGIHYWYTPKKSSVLWFIRGLHKDTETDTGLFNYYTLFCCIRYRYPNKTNFVDTYDVVSDEITVVEDSFEPGNPYPIRQVRKVRRGGKSSVPTYIHLASYLQKFIVYPKGKRTMDLLPMMSKGRSWLTDNTSADPLHHNKILMMALASLSESSTLEEQVMSQLTTSGILESPNY